MIMNEHSKQVNDLLNRRSFIKGGAGTVLPAVTASFLTGLKLRGTGFVALMYAASMYNKLKRLSIVFIVFIVFISFPGLALDQQAPSPSAVAADGLDRKSTRLNSSHRCISYAVFCLKKKKK